MAQQPLSPRTSRPASSSSSGSANTPKHSKPSPLSTDPTLPARKDSSSQQASPSPSLSHRSSLVENFRNYPPSPRAQRNPSFSGQALNDLIMHPAVKGQGGDDARFKDRDWRSIQVSELVEPGQIRFVELDTSIEDTTKLLIKSGAPNVVLIRESRKTRTTIGTFDFSDLNAYLLLVLGLSQPDELASQLAERARSGEAIPLSDVNDHLGTREEPAFLPHTANLIRAMEVLGGGAHRIVVCKDGTSEAVGVLSQLRLVRFFWDNHQNFSATEQLYARSLKELDLGVKEVLAINGDTPVADALRLMHDEGITSLPVLDNHRNVVGNISHVDVRLLTDTSSIPLLSSTCIHFIGVILSERGRIDGRDSYPVFHVTPFSTLAHTVAKLCATHSHRMWIVDAPSPSTSVPPSPSMHNVPPPFSMNHPTTQLPAPAAHLATPARHGSIGAEMTPAPPYTSMSPGVSVSAGQLPGQGMSGRLSGVVSLTDILNLFARTSGLSPADPEEMRNRRRRRSSASSGSRPVNIESMRPSGEALRKSGDLARRPSGEAMRTSGELGRSASGSSRR
ncbi:hypothetical protein LTR08_003209 [Meristemomyces frigidus]|nr:hypothetical protein LTR08_003209 [Meristemomyces frigidus]